MQQQGGNGLQISEFSPLNFTSFMRTFALMSAHCACALPMHNIITSMAITCLAHFAAKGILLVHAAVVLARLFRNRVSTSIQDKLISASKLFKPCQYLARPGLNAKLLDRNFGFCFMLLVIDV